MLTDLGKLCAEVVLLERVVRQLALKLLDEGKPELVDEVKIQLVMQGTNCNRGDDAIGCPMMDLAGNEITSIAIEGSPSIGIDEDCRLHLLPPPFPLRPPRSKLVLALNAFEHTRGKLAPCDGWRHVLH